MYGGGIGNGNLHEHTDLPCLLAGKLAGAVKTGYHCKYALETNVPMTNLPLTLLDKAGVPVEKLGDSTGRIEPDYLSI